MFFVIKSLIKFRNISETGRIFLSTGNYFIKPNGQVFIKNKHQRFIDSLRITVRGGNGGNGYPKYHGIGGNGGNVCLIAKSNIKLIDVKNSREKNFHAEDGQHSSRYAIIGRDGKDLEIKVPTGVTVILDQFQREIAELNEDGDKVIVAFGGRGGDKLNSYCGTKGEKTIIRLDLKLLADVGLIGYPNAGKSTLLRALSRASPKIASYPFTTIQPNLGVIEYDPPKSIQLYSDRMKNDSKNFKFYDQDYRQITVADLPGLIDGAHRNIGLGHQFLKHIIRTNLLLFVVDIDGFKNVGGKDYHESWYSNGPIEVIKSLINEIHLYDSRILPNKRTILVISKLDTSEKRNQFIKLTETLKKIKINVPSSSTTEFNDQKNQVEENLIDENTIHNNNEENLFKFDKIIGISSIKNYNIERLKGMIRRLIDLDYETKQFDQQQQQQPTSFRESMSQQQQQQQQNYDDYDDVDNDDDVVVDDRNQNHNLNKNLKI